jgi:ATP-binding cassette subfamily F protein 3
VIRIQGLVLSRGTSRLLDGADASISAGERVALIGLNGSGKSTLFAALTGELSPEQGSVEQPYRKVTLLRQSAPSGSMPAWRYLLDGDPRLCAAEQALEVAQAQMIALEAQALAGDAREQTGFALAQANSEWLDAGGADARPRAMALLAGLGFQETQAEESVDRLSGGWRMRLNLARALFDPGDLLLLDEPTNHLDLDAIVWLERWLQRLEGTLIVISHDRDFLDKVVQTTFANVADVHGRTLADGFESFEDLDTILGVSWLLQLF